MAEGLLRGADMHTGVGVPYLCCGFDVQQILLACSNNGTLNHFHDTP